VGDYRVVSKVEGAAVYMLAIRHRKIVYEDVTARNKLKPESALARSPELRWLAISDETGHYWEETIPFP
jgi:hypothetical protein